VSYALLLSIADDFSPPFFPQSVGSFQQRAEGVACISVLGPDVVEVSRVIACNDNVCIIGDVLLLTRADVFLHLLFFHNELSLDSTSCSCFLIPCGGGGYLVYTR
jgi:hypothetical protein